MAKTSINGAILPLVSCLLLLIVPIVNSQRSTDNESLSASQSLNRFALNLLSVTAKEAGSELNIAISPYTIWSLLTIIAEGARENTARELNSALGLPTNKVSFRRSYGALSNQLMRPTSGVTLELSNAIFTAAEHELLPEFRNTVRNVYGVDVMPVDFRDKARAARTINDYVAQKTRNKVLNFMSRDDMQSAKIVTTSTLYFKGDWQVPFNKSATRRQPFHDDFGKVLADVDMMFQEAPFPYTLITDPRSLIVELPYGKDNKMAMIVLVPSRGTVLADALQTISRSPFSNLVQKLRESAEQFEDEDVRVYLPKFHVNSDLTLNGVLKTLGITEVFNDQAANLLGIVDDYLYLTRVFQKADIAVDEEGTVATSAAGGTVAYKSPPPKFEANRPFAYFIYDKQTEGIVFMGTVVNPNTI